MDKRDKGFLIILIIAGIAGLLARMNIISLTAALIIWIISGGYLLEGIISDKIEGLQGRIDDLENRLSEIENPTKNPEEY